MNAVAGEVLKIRTDGPVVIATLNRPNKRNAMSDELLSAIETFFAGPPQDAKVIILTGTAGHYCSGLDLSEHVVRDAEATMRHSRNWHRIMDMVQYGGRPVVSAMFGAVIGGGLELAAATHVRV